MSYLPFPEYDEDGKVICQICGESFNVISPSHLGRKHDVTMEQYRQRFSDAPLNTEKFKLRQKYTHSPLFEREEPEEVEVQEQPEILDKIDKEEEKKLFKEVKEDKPKPTRPTDKSKSTILNELRKYYPHVRQDYIIQKFSSIGPLEYEFVTDFADPILRVIINFPDTFWHNQDYYMDYSKNNKLVQDGWKIIEIHSKNPTPKQIKEALSDS